MFVFILERTVPVVYDSFEWEMKAVSALGIPCGKPASSLDMLNSHSL